MPALTFPECPEILPPVTDNRDLVFIYNGVQYPYNAVKVGEYYWMDGNFNVPINNIPITKEQIDYHHEMYGMFNWNSLSENKTYWQHLGEQMGMPNPTDQQIRNILIPEFEKYYGTYYSAHREVSSGANPLNPVSILRRLGSMKEIVDGKSYGNDTINHWPGGIRSQVIYKYWDMPTTADVLQLLAMCGHGTTPEVRQYLSYAENEVSVAFATRAGFDWFAPGVDLFTKYGAGEFNLVNANKYKLNMTPNGFRWGIAQKGFQVKTEHGFVYPDLFPHEFNGAGMNQVLVYPLINKKFDKDNINMESRIHEVLEVGDMPDIKYNRWSGPNMHTVRWCRALTDRELGYKLYINQNVSDVLGDKESDKVDIFTDKIGVQTRYRSYSGEELLLQKVRSGLIQPSAISIVKLGLNDPIPSGYVELPRGYIRGFYVQYILDNPSPSKNIADIINIATKNPFIWIDKNVAANPTSVTTRAVLVENNPTNLLQDRVSGIKIQPNPVSDVLHLVGKDARRVNIYNASGALVLSAMVHANSVSVNVLVKGVYVVKVETVDGQIEVLRMIKN